MKAPDFSDLIVVGCNHDRTPLAIRERIALSQDQVDLLLHRLNNAEGIQEVLVLNTCNRVEVYAVTKHTNPQSYIESEICRLNNFPHQEFSQFAYSHSNLDAINHLFRVSAGLDSQLIGETEIFGQVKDAYDLSIRKKTAGRILHRFLQKSFQAGKWARTHTSIGNGHVSIGNVSVDLATRIFGNLQSARMLVVGSGDVGHDVANAFRNRGISQLTIASRTPENAQALAQEVSGIAIPFKNWPYELSNADVIVFATSARENLLTSDSLKPILHKRRDRPVFLIDLSLPRNIDPRCEEFDNVFLYNLDDLSAIARENLESRKAKIQICESELNSRAQRLAQQLLS